ncbi:hypothetical protein [Shewanella maritima]|uniref:hypothetical protein n=1 Tax=Shewanella maritima TaxID=2520507 RepID=UPI00373710C8
MAIKSDYFEADIKVLGLTCQSCDRMSEIEGEKVCFEKGKITRLRPDTRASEQIKIVCAYWQKK